MGCVFGSMTAITEPRIARPMAETTGDLTERYQR
jgi:hypothetical protein